MYSKRFYGGLLTAGDQKRDSVLAPYTLLDLAHPETPPAKGISNEKTNFFKIFIIGVLFPKT